MKIHNTVPYFIENYMPIEEFLKQYHDKYSPQFKEYFLLHCKNADEKIRAAIHKYPNKMIEIKESSGKIEELIHQIVVAYEQKYNVEFSVDVHIIVGAYGSNAFTHRQIIPEVTFCLEKLSSKSEDLKVIIAHEFGHVLHNILSDKSGMDWSKLDWLHPYTWLLQEGCATYFSKLVTVADEAVYFLYEDGGEEWLRFAEANRKEIVTTFKKDLNKYSPTEIKHEWFSINGGTNFGHTRLGYFIGYHVLQLLIEKYGEYKAVTLWKEPNFKDEVDNLLLDLCK